MIEFTTGDILEAKAEALVNTVNCVGFMGRGIALQFRKAFPKNFEAYAAACKREEVRPGHMFVFETGALTGPKYIINFPTKRHWRAKSRIEDIAEGLEALREEVRARGIGSVAVPPLGAGLGGLDWRDVRALVVRVLGSLARVQVTVYEPDPARGERAQPWVGEAPTMTSGRAALLGLMDQYLAGLLDPFITLLEIHKITYFLQLAGEPLRLKFVRASYGPYAENLRHVLARLEGHFITGFVGGGDQPSKELQLVPGAMEDARRVLKGNPATEGRIARVADLVEGFETPFGLELLATVLWVAHEMGNPDPASVIAGTYAWGERKRQFSERQIRLALQVLGDKRWLAA